MNIVEERIKSKKMIVAPLKHCGWWSTIGVDFLEKQVLKQLEWEKIDKKDIPQYLAGQGWDPKEIAKALWMCGICGETHCPKVDLKDRILALAGLDGKVVLARIGDFDFNDLHTWKQHTGINSKPLSKR